MRPGSAGRKLGEKQGGHKEAVGGEFDQSHFSRSIYPGDFEPSMADALSICRIETVVACELLGHCDVSIRPVREGLWQNRDGLGGADQRTGQLAYHQARSLRGGFFVFCIVDREYIARILDQSMLKPSSGPNEGPALFTREPDRLQRALHALVRTGWRTPQGVKALQRGLTAGMLQ
jgi:hypothetical protein